MSFTHRIILLADTHVGDRTRQLDPALVQAIAREKPEVILHAGDICTPACLQTLAQIAPVHAVQGNRDWFKGYKLPTAIHFEAYGLRFTLTHGHINMFQWALNYLRTILTLRLTPQEHFRQQLARHYPQADVILYGHTHEPCDLYLDGRRFLNPGVGYPQARKNYRFGYLLLLLHSDGRLESNYKELNAERTK